ncbi:hypothetical protein ES703_18791 [subsurface metagenome]
MSNGNISNGKNEASEHIVILALPASELGFLFGLLVSCRRSWNSLLLSASQSIYDRLKEAVSKIDPDIESKVEEMADLLEGK